VPEEAAVQPLVLRVRGWCLDAQQDSAWRDLLTRFLTSRSGRKYNLQLHPPVGYNDDLVVNTLGNLDFGGLRVFEAQIHGLGADETFHVEWPMVPAEQVRPVSGKSIALPYQKSRPSRLSSAADVLPDIHTLEELLPGHDVAALVGLLEIETRIEVSDVDVEAVDEELLAEVDDDVDDP
jgi:hypothetical protein